MKNLAMRFLVLFFLFYLGKAQAFTAGSPQHQKYLGPEECNLSLFIAPPPADNSDRTKAEIAEILSIQSSRTKEMASFAIADQELSVFRFADVIGPSFNKENLPVTAEFFNNVIENAKDIINVYKAYWHRPRPYRLDGRIKPCVDKPAIDSYPSGHSTIGNLMATILANMIPEKKREIFGRGWKFGINRIIGGVHYRSDVEAGRICAAVIAAGMFRNSKFKYDYELSKEELRRVLKFTN
jgi:acid phosphatase (class A)